MLTQIPTHLIAGPLGAGKTSLLRHLLRHKPQHERWAVLINEFGQVGMDLALLSEPSAHDISLSEIPGGCLCCVNGLPFQVGLGRLLRRAKPDRVFIESSGLGHPLQLLQQLGEPPWQGVLALQPLIMVLDSGALAAGRPLADAQQQALSRAGLLVCNKAEQLNEADRQRLRETLEFANICFTEHGALTWQQLPQRAAGQMGAPQPEARPGPPMLPALWLHQANWISAHQLQQSPYSVGWRMSPLAQFRLADLQRWLAKATWVRAKGVMHTDQGWKAFNLLPERPPSWQDSLWRQDNRVELISAELPPVGELEAGLRAAVQSQ